MAEQDDDLQNMINSLSHSLEVSTSRLEEISPESSNFLDLYKNSNRVERQRKKRDAELKSHRQGLRSQALMKARCLTEELLKEDEDLEENLVVMEDVTMADGDSTSKSPSHHHRRVNRVMKEQLMSGEWLLSVPEHFEEEYCMKLFPTGRHVLIAAARHRTCVYSRSGRRLMTFLSQLPGGGMVGMHPDREGYLTLLDCVLSQDKTTFWVLDVMYWKLNSYYDSQTQLRFQNLQSLYHDQLLSCGTDCGATFAVVPFFNVDQQNLRDIFSQPMNYSVDGVMLYHKEGAYVPGHTTLLGWLKPYMVGDMFGIPHVHPAYLEGRPEGYKDVAGAIRAWNESHAYYWDHRQSEKQEAKEEQVSVS